MYFIILSNQLIIEYSENLIFRIYLLLLPRVFSISNSINPNVPILTSRENVFAVSIDLHVIQRGLACHVVARQKLRQAERK